MLKENCWAAGLLFLLGTGCDTADWPPVEPPSRLQLSEVVLRGKLVPGVRAGGDVQPSRLIFARLDAPSWFRYFHHDGSGRPSPASRPWQRRYYRVDWSISAKGDLENLLVNSVAPGRFIATSAEGRTLGANNLATGAYAFFVADAAVPGGDYVVRAVLHDGAEPPQTVGVWARSFELSDAFAFPSFFRFQVRGVAVSDAVFSKTESLYPAPVTGSYDIDFAKDAGGSPVPHSAEATVFLASSATSSKKKVLYYDFTSLTKGYAIEYYGEEQEKGEPEIVADPSKPTLNPRPKLLVSKIIRRENRAGANNLPAQEETHAVTFEAENGTTASGRVVLWVRDQRSRRGALTVYLRALKQ